MLPLLASLNQLRIVLASQSPRRRAILETVGLAFEVRPSTFPETLDKSKFTPAEYVVENARQKALEVMATLAAEEGGAPALVIGADTVVVLDDAILEKPADEAAAVAMLGSLQGRSHTVLTGVALVVPPAAAGGAPVVADAWASATSVQFSPVSDASIAAYVATGEPFDKAGGYGIQGVAGLFVAGVEGDYQTVVGFPLHDFGTHLAGIAEAHLGIAPPAAAAAAAGQ